MRFLSTIAALCVALVLPFAALAGGHGSAPAFHDGVLLPATTHGQKQILLHNQNDILALAKHHLTDAEALRVRQFARDQRNACWPIGWLPALAAPDASPFHACGHAYAAGLHYLFQRLVREHHTTEVNRMEKLFHRPEAFAVCSQSVIRTSTANLVVTLRSEWVFGSLGVACFGSFFAAVWRRRRRPLQQATTWRPAKA